MVNKTIVTVVIPLYNPPLRWCESCLEHIYALETTYPQYKFNFIFVNDGSCRKIFGRIRQLMTNSAISHSFYSLKSNHGKGRALRFGLSKSAKKSQYYICVDWDFPFGILVIDKILDKLKHSDVVIADRGDDYLQHLPRTRSLLTRSWRLFFSTFFKLDLGDTQSGIKGFNNKAKNCFLSCQVDSFLQDLEFLLLCQKDGMKITSVPAFLRGGVILRGFPLTTYWRELKTLLYIIVKYRISPGFLEQNKA